MKIYIKGFKSISDGQYAALGKKLTFLVGPNSAGKSVVMHALEKLKGGDPQFDPEDQSLHYSPFGDRVTAVQALGFEWQDGDDLIEYRATVFDGEYFRENPDRSIEVYGDQLVYKTHENELPRLVQPKKMMERIIAHARVSESVFYDQNTGIARPKKTGDADSRKTQSSYGRWNVEGINFSSSHINKAKMEATYEWLIELWSAAASSEDWAEDIAAFKAQWHADCFLWERDLILQVIRSKFSGLERQNRLNQFGHHDAIIKKVLEKIDGRFRAGYPGRRLEVSLVSADRVLPTEEDVNACLSNLIVPLVSYHDLIRSFLAAEWDLDWFDGHIDNTEQTPGKRTVAFLPTGQIAVIVSASDAAVLAESVNKALAENLFIDNGYQIGVSSTLRIRRIDLVRGTHVEKYRDENKKWLPQDELLFDAHMHLMDAHGRRLQFSDVGSGIGYVLPVLIECFRRKNAGKVVFIQQPELHLHPALQAALCDVLIDAAKDRMIISETHSEHLILRALKRIRQTFNQTLVDEELRLYPEDVAVNYFEPQPDGSTRVHILRIAPDGEFIDRWPNGFFPERDQELFDE